VHTSIGIINKFDLRIAHVGHVYQLDLSFYLKNKRSV